MTGRSILIFSLAVVMFSSCNKEDNSTVTPTNNGNNNTTAPLNPNQEKLLSLVNKSRSEGCNCGNQYFKPVGPVAWNSQLESAAKKHSDYMNTSGNFSHTGENNSDPGKRITAEGYVWMTYGENIAEGYSTEEDVIKAWLKSKGHCENIMNGDFKEMGVATSGKYWTQVFGAK